MVAGAVAGFSPSGKTVVREVGRLYLAVMGAALLFSALLWSGNSNAVIPAQLPIHFYRNVVGELDGRTCPSYPVCSHYAGQALARHGMFLGSWLAMDRLIHEGDEMKTGIWLMVEGEQRLYDPLNRNDFWLRKED